MSKKKDNGDDGLKGILSRISNLSQLNDLLSNMDEEEMMRFYDLVSNNTLTDQLLDDTWYSYNRPDYSSMAKPLAKWLLPLAKVANLNEVAIVSREAIEKAARLENLTDGLPRICICAILSFMRRWFPGRSLLPLGLCSHS